MAGLIRHLCRKTSQKTANRDWMTMLIDLHTHILYGVDDGPESIDLSMEMLRSACSGNIRAVVATPHILDGFQSEELIFSHFRKLTGAVIEEKLPIDIFLGSEINFQFGMEDFLESSVGTFRGMGRYFLVETTLTHYPKHFEETMSRILEGGRVPVFAHPERVGPIVGDTDLIRLLVGMGMLVQINAGSLLGMFGERIRKFAWDLLDLNVVHFVASDAHDIRRRTFNLDEAWKAVRKKYDEDTADLLMFDNPLRVLTGESITG